MYIVSSSVEVVYVEDAISLRRDITKLMKKGGLIPHQKVGIEFH